MEQDTTPQTGSRIGALFWVTLALAVPVLVVAIFAVSLGFVWLWWAVAICAPVVGGLGVVAWLHIGQVKSIDGYLRQLAEDVDNRTARAGGPIGRPPNLYGWGMERLASLARQLAIRYDGRIKGLSSKLEELGAVAETIADPLLLVGDDRKVTLDNEAARQRFGVSLVGLDVANGLRDPDVLGAVDAVLAGDEARTIVLDSLAPTPDRVYEMRIAPFPNSRASKRHGALLSLHDITAIKRSEQMRADFVANASHELRNPLSILSGYVETLQTTARGDQEATDEFLRVMSVQSGRMTRLINDLLSLSRVEIDELTRPNGTVGLKLLIATVADYLRPKAQAKKMTLVVDCPDLPEIIGDPLQIEQVLTNLIDNAINYGAPETEVLITAGLRASDEQVAGPVIDIAVRDFGDGIPREHLSRLTERFYRVDKARSRAAGGTGLGLAIVKHIVARHRGRLVIRSSQEDKKNAEGGIERRGSHFTVVLPIDLTTA